MLVHSAKYNTPLHEFGINKPFALDRGQLVLSELQALLRDMPDVFTPQPVSMEQAQLVHTRRYIDSLSKPATWQQIFELTDDDYNPGSAMRPLNELLDDIAFKSGGTLLAARLAVQGGLAANLGGGYHHAFPDQGRGFCVLNDIAIAIRELQQEKRLGKAMIVDVDFHQGDGCAVIFHNDDSVFTLSIHSREGWPDVKQESDLDIEIASDEQHLYLERLQTGLNKALARFSPELVVFVAGSDPYELDVLPGTAFIKLPLPVMRARDELVLRTFAKLGVPLAMVFAGGYGPHVWEVHFHAVKTMCELAGYSAYSEKRSIGL